MTFWQDHRFEAAARDEEQLLRGAGCYVDDMRLAGETQGYVLRSAHAHAFVRAIDVSAARAAPGILAVLTAADLVSRVRPLGCVMALRSHDGSSRAEADRAILAGDRVRHVGDGVAFVVAETLEQARDAAALIAVDYDPLPAVIEPGQGTAVPIWPETQDNLCFDWRFGDDAACRHLMDTATHRVTLTLRSPRIVPAALEPRGAIGGYDAERDLYTLIANTQGVHFVRRVLAKAFSLPEARLRVITPNVGGGFGSKIFAYPEQALVLCAARIVGRPVRWTCGRDESFVSDTQARDHTTEATLGLDAAGRFVALSVRATVNLGAYLSQYTPLTATGVGAPVQAGAYGIQALEIQVRGAFTNTVPVDAYRGAGRPEANYVLERLIDRAASELAIDPAELRARNMPDSQVDSITSVTGLTIDGGRFLDNQRRCLALADRDGFARRRAESGAQGLLRGFGFANYLEANGGLAVAKMIEPGGVPVESAALTFSPKGALRILVGTQSTGQDHATPLALYAAKNFGLHRDAVTVEQGDSDALPSGGGTGGSKSLLTSSVALEQAIADAIARGRALLAQAWATKPDAIHFDRGLFSLAGSNRTMSMTELAATFPGGLDGLSQGTLRHGSCANGCHACEVEIDPETGQVRVVRYSAVDDFGRVVNEAAVRGQVQGGVAQGIGQALMEQAIYDRATGQLLNGSMADYALPHAAQVPDVDWRDNGLPSRTNVFGAKACGEAGASAAPPAVMNAIVDALARYPGAWSLQMPARAADVWRIIRADA